MKKLALIALAAFATSAFATGNIFFPPQTCETCPQIDILGTSTQSVSATWSGIKNESSGDGANAQQNVSSNSGNVKVAASSTQMTTAVGSTVSNKAEGKDAYASQNVSSNVGKVNIGATSIQTTFLSGSYVGNKAGAGSKAVQNLASNNGCSACK